MASATQLERAERSCWLDPKGASDRSRRCDDAQAQLKDNGGDHRRRVGRTDTKELAGKRARLSRAGTSPSIPSW